MGIETAVETKPRQLFIGGHWVNTQSGKAFATTNPATGDTIAQIAEGGEADVDAAVNAARSAFESGPWASMSAMDRGKLLWKVRDLIMQHADELARLETMDSGKTISEARQIEVPMVANLFQHYAGWCTKIHGETILVGYRTEGALAILELCNPPANCYTYELNRALDEAILKASFDDNVHAIILNVFEYAKQFVPPAKASKAVGRIKRAVQSGSEVFLLRSIGHNGSFSSNSSKARMRRKVSRRTSKSVPPNSKAADTIQRNGSVPSS